MKRSLQNVRTSILFILSFLFFEVSVASNNVSLPPCPVLPPIPVVASDGSVYFVYKDIGHDSSTFEDAKNRSKPWATIQTGVAALRARDTFVTGFRDIALNNYDLREGSPAINRGCIIGVAEGIHRRPRELNASDIGAFEYLPGTSQ